MRTELNYDSYLKIYGYDLNIYDSYLKRMELNYDSYPEVTWNIEENNLQCILF